MDVTMAAQCPICGVDVPARLADEPTSAGLTVTFDTALLDEHIDMHRACTCRWARASRHHDDACPVHG